MHGDVSRALNEHLNIMTPCDLCELTEHIQFKELRTVIGVMYGPWPEAVAERYCYIILFKNLTYFLKMSVEKVFFAVHDSPACHYRSSSRHYSCQSFSNHVRVSSQSSGMDCEIIDTLLSLFDEGIAIYFPSEVFNFTVYFFKGLINGYRSHRHRTISDNPLTGLVDIVACRKVHKCVATPITAPHGLAYFLFDSGRKGGVTDIGIEFYQKITADNHRFCFRVVYVGRKHCSAGGYFITYKLRSDMAFDSKSVGIGVFTDSHIFHLRGDDSLSCESHLGYGFAFLRSARCISVSEADIVEGFVSFSRFAVIGGYRWQLFEIVAAGNPLLTHARESLVDVNRYCGIGIGSARIVNCYGGIFSSHFLSIDDFHRWSEIDLSHRDFDWVNLTRNVDFFRGGIGTDVYVFYFHCFVLGI